MPLTLTLEADAKGNNVFFLPLTRTLRGSLDFMQIKEKNARQIDLPPVPGQRLEIDWTSGTAAVIEPLCEPAHATLRRRLEKHGVGATGGGCTIPEAREVIPKIDLASSYFWAKRLCADGLLKVVSGDFPKEAPPGKVRKSLIFRETETKTDKRLDSMNDALTRLTESAADNAKTTQALLAVLLATLPTAQRTAVMEQLNRK